MPTPLKKLKRLVGLKFGEKNPYNRSETLCILKEMTVNCIPHNAEENIIRRLKEIIEENHDRRAEQRLARI